MEAQKRELILGLVGRDHRVLPGGGEAGGGPGVGQAQTAGKGFAGCRNSAGKGMQVGALPVQGAPGSSASGARKVA